MTDILTTGGFGGADSGWGAAAGAFAGSLFGSWFGDGFNGNGRNNSSVETGILNDGINSIQGAINSVNMNLSNGLSSVGYQALDQSGRTNLAMMQGFSSLGHDNCQNTNAIVAAINNVGFNQQQCCCDTKSAIREEGCATRETIQRNVITELQTQLSDEKAENAALKSQLYTTNVVNGQTAILLGALERLRPTTATTVA